MTGTLTRTTGSAVHRRTSAPGWLATRWLRRRWTGTLPVALIMLVGATGAMAALATSDRTSSAYGDYLRRANVGDLVVNPSVSTRQIDEVIRRLPAVEQVTTSAMFATTFDDGAPRTRQEVEANGGSQTFVTGSADGRFIEMDRPIVQSGRMPTGPNEAAASVEAAEAEGLHIGDVVPIAFWQPGVADGLDGEALEAYASERISPAGVEQVTVVGIVTLPDEALPDDLYPRQRMLVSPDVAARYECLPDEPPPGVSLAEAVELLLPAGCAVQYHYYSLALANGADDVKPMLEAFLQISTAMNEALLDIGDIGEVPGDAPQYFVIPTETMQELDRVERANRPTVAALLVLGLAAALATAALIALAASRELRRTTGDMRQWHQLGVGSTTRAAVAGLPLVVGVLTGALLAIVASWLVAPGPIGLVQVVEPHAARRLNASALVALVAVTAFALLVIAVMSVSAARRQSSFASQRASSPRPFRLRLGPPAPAEGIRAAFGQRSAIPVFVGLAMLSGAFVASVSFGSSLSSLLSTPRSYGWPWDVAAMTGGGYGDLDVDAANQQLANDPDVRGFSVIGFLNEITLNGDPMMSVVQFEHGPGSGLSVLSGTLPDAGDEVAVGAWTADERGIEVGDVVRVAGGPVEMDVRVTGLVVFPGLGPMLADRVGTGTGLYVPAELFDSPELVDVRGELDGLRTFIGIDLHDGVDRDAAIARLQVELVGLDMLGAPAWTYPEPIRPPEIVDAVSARTVPTTVGLVFAGLAAVAMTFASWASARSRRRELAVLQTLGFTRSQVRQTVWVQSVATAVGALLIGAPLGAIAGRALWRSFADQLGVVPDPTTPVARLVVALVAGIVLAFLAAQVPAHVASRARVAEGLRAE